jgi:hypothetical protein
MWKAIFPVVLMLVSVQSPAEIPCPIMLVSADANQDSITLSFMNKGKVPVQQLNLACTTRGTICHTESGLFYPGMEYSIDFSYPGAAHRAKVVTLEMARLAGGVVWTRTPSQSCRTLKVTVNKNNP